MKVRNICTFLHNQKYFTCQINRIVKLEFFISSNFVKLLFQLYKKKKWNTLELPASCLDPGPEGNIFVRPNITDRHTKSIVALCSVTMINHQYNNNHQCDLFIFFIHIFQVFVLFLFCSLFCVSP